MTFECVVCGDRLRVTGSPPFPLPASHTSASREEHKATWLLPALLHPAESSSSPRPSWDQTFLAHARETARRSTCLRKQVGAVLTVSNRIVAAGYAGAARGRPHCIDPGVGCLTGPDGTGCVRTVHAEINAVLNAALNGVSTDGATLYCTLSPCMSCLLMLCNAGIERIVYSERYRIFDEVEKETIAMGIQLEQLA